LPFRGSISRKVDIGSQKATNPRLCDFNDTKLVRILVSDLARRWFRSPVGILVIVFVAGNSIAIFFPDLQNILNIGDSFEGTLNRDMKTPNGNSSAMTWSTRQPVLLLGQFFIATPILIAKRDGAGSE
jgi:hypothetical protein